jgi:ribosomal protein S18 acetylase RimI-like enzyme
MLLMARIGECARAFSIVVPHLEVLEVLCLAVDPEAWGNGFARQLLDHTGLFVNWQPAPIDYDKFGWPR